MAEHFLPRVLMIARRMTPSQRLCGHEQLRALCESGYIEYQFCETAKLTASLLAWADTLLIARGDNALELAAMRQAKAAGRLVGYMLDDDLPGVPESLPCAAHYGDRQVRKSIRSLIECADFLLSPSPVLLEKYGTGKETVRIEEPAVQSVVFVPHDEDAPVVIGFAGSADRFADVQDILGDVLPEIAKTENVRFEFIGAQPELAEKLGAACLPYFADYQEYRIRLNGRKWDIGLAPMPDSEFARCKHYNKFIEYAASGACCVMSALPPYTRLDEPGFPGVFCENTKEAWTSALRSLIHDRPRLEKMRMEASNLAHSRFSISQTAQELLLSAPAFLSHIAPQENTRFSLAGAKVTAAAQRAAEMARRSRKESP